MAALLTHGERLLTKTAFPLVIGRHPSDIAAFFAPLAYSFGIGSTEVAGPFVVNGRPVQAGAYYVVLPGKRGAVVLGSREDVAEWAKLVNESPMSDLIGTVCQEEVVEILAPSTSLGHPWYAHLRTCFERHSNT